MAFDWLSNNSGALLAASAGLLGGRTANEQASMGISGFGNAVAATQSKNKTLEFLRQMNPQIAAAVEAGAMSPLDGYKTHLEAQKPKSPLEINGKLVDPSTYQVLADFSTPAKGPEGTSLMRELEAAGLQPGSPEYQQAILAANKPKGMMIESDGQGGFRMVQGTDLAGGANLNVEQGKNTGFLLRAQESNNTVDKLESEGTSLYNRVLKAAPMGLGNYGLGEGAQKLEQAKRDFINAVLRQESGAVISPEEFANAEQQYFPQPGDSEAVIQQKAKNRENAVSGFRIRSGPGAASVDQMQAHPPQAGGVVDYTDYFK